MSKNVRGFKDATIKASFWLQVSWLLLNNYCFISLKTQIADILFTVVESTLLPTDGSISVQPTRSLLVDPT